MLIKSLINQGNLANLVNPSSKQIFEKNAIPGLKGINKAWLSMEFLEILVEPVFPLNQASD